MFLAREKCNNFMFSFSPLLAKAVLAEVFILQIVLEVFWAYIL